VETAVASMIFDRKSVKGKNDKKGEVESEEQATRPKGGYFQETTEVEGLPLSSKPLKNEVIPSSRDTLKDRGSVGFFGRLFRRNVKQNNDNDTDPNGTVDMDSSVVMKYLGERAKMDSKFVISVFDFGGQSVFNGFILSF
jgi:hypothetical protein